MMHRFVLNCTVFGLLAMAACCFLPAPASAGTIPDEAGAGALKTATLEAGIQTAPENNRRRPAAQFPGDMAEAQHRQTLAGYWPQINFRGG